MPRNVPRQRASQPHLEYLGVDQFIQTVIDARALKTAFELRLVDRLLERQPRTIDEMASAAGADPQGFRFLLGLLSANRVLVERNGEIALSERFMGLLRFRDLLETKLDFAGFLSGDFIELFTTLITDPKAFMERSRLFGLFDYGRAQEHTQENYERTKVWMRLTTTLTRYEAQACLHHHDFGGYRRMLDVGGNSGEFALQLCRATPALTATVFDLPLVCDIGQERLLAEPEHSRIGFVKGDARADPLPGGYDLVTFKSMLHDWPEADADAFLRKARGALEPGGTVLIFERAPIHPEELALNFSMLPTLLFFRSYRDPAFYEARLHALGFTAVTVERFDLETPFFVVSGRKTPA
jgi:SAM-dependent methyltransferase